MNTHNKKMRRAADFVLTITTFCTQFFIIAKLKRITKSIYDFILKLKLNIVDFIPIANILSVIFFSLGKTKLLLTVVITLLELLLILKFYAKIVKSLFA